MANRRSVKISASAEKVVSVSGKPSRGRPRNASKFKVPTVITISVPGKTECLDVPDNEKRVDVHTKIALANEVAKSQLSKEPIEARGEPAPKPKRGRKRRNETGPDFFINDNTNRSFNVKVVQTKQTPNSVKSSIKRTSAPPALLQGVVTRKRKAESSENEPKIKKQKEPKRKLTEPLVLKKEPLDENVPSNDDIITETTENKPKSDLVLPMVVIPTKDKRICRRKSNNNIPRKPRVNRAKSSNKESKSQSPILQISNIKSPQRGVKICNTDRVENRKISPTNSISNLSWTHDISSTTTCITVSSKEYVCFNNKMPVVKLNNINNKISRTVPNINNKTISSHDSSSSNIDASCDQSLPLVDCNSTDDVDPLNLGCSPHNNISLQKEHNKINSNKKAHARAAENLLRALEKIDMEFINWIHEPEYVSPDLNKLKDKLFNILHSEFCAITHCRSLQNLSVNAKSDCSIVSKSINKNKSQVEMVNVSINSDKTNNNVIQNDELNVSKVDSLLVVSDPVQKRCVKNRDETKILASETVKHASENKKVEDERDFVKSSTSGVIGKLAKKDFHVSDSEDSSNADDLGANVKVKTFAPHNPHDDDDTLSLFAESITGLESSKLNVSTENDHNVSVDKRTEEYVPEPVQKLSPNYTYCPTKIGDQAKNGIVKTVCEKQNADSTSIYKEPDSNSPTIKESDTAPVLMMVRSDDEQDSQKKCLTLQPQILTHNNMKKALIADLYKLKAKTINVIFKGYCYFNIIEKCTAALYNKPCRYSHDIPDQKEIKNKLSVLDEETFIREYMLIRRNGYVMCRYGICFVEECAQRQLTRILVEMAFDFIMKGSLTDDALKVNAVEITLMHLNNVDLSECDDLLKMRVCRELLLCEVFMKIMASTQNFSRFKSVFLSLTYFLVNNDRTFSLDVAEQILERVCILPFDEPVVRALIQIMRWTNPMIFLNSMIVKFEKQISAYSDIFAEYASVKREINFENIGRRVDFVPMVLPVDKQSYQPMAAPALRPDRDQTLSEVREVVPLPPSPDTTHLDIMNKAAEEKLEPKIIRTITGINSNSKSRVGFSPSSSISEENFQNSSPKSWRKKSIYQKIDTSPSNQQMKNLRREQRLVTLRGRHANYSHPGAMY